MRVSDVIFTVERTLRDILEALANRLTFTDNMACVIREVADTGAADVEFTVSHDLQRVPTHYLANASEGYVYDGNRTNWTLTEMTLRCSASNASVKLVVF